MRKFLNKHKDWFILGAVVLVVDVIFALTGFGGIWNFVVTTGICLGVIFEAKKENKPIGCEFVV